MITSNSRRTSAGRQGRKRRRSAVLWAGTLLAVIGWAGCSPSGEPSGAVDPAELQAAADSLLTASAEAWNAGDLDGFLYWYQRGPETTYIGSSGLIHGWDAIRERYLPAFEPGASRDSLRFEDLETRPLAPDLGLAVARYVLFQGDSTTANGSFTLVLRRTPAGWRIIHDHSSASVD
jgi:ketosteroid isomerase-like protein